MSEFVVVLVALYRYQNFPIRILHSVLENIEGVRPYTIFFKDRGSAIYNPSTKREEKLFVKLITELKPKLVGFSVLSPYLRTAKRVTMLVKENLPSSLVIWGGIHPTVYPESCIDEVDMLCLGEGEGALTDLAISLRDGKPCQSIKNLWMKDGDRIIKNPMRPLIQELDSLPFASSAKDSYFFIESNKISKKDTVFSSSLFFIQSSRGCPYACSYCVNGLLRPLFKDLGAYTRTRSVDSVIKEIKENCRMNYVVFSDETFGTNTVWLDEFECRYKKEIGLPFWIECNPKNINSRTLDKLVNAGIDTINFGIQTGSDYIRNQIFKRAEKNNEILTVAQEITKRNVKIKYDFIIDNPYDTEETLKGGIELLLKLPKPLFFNLYSLQYFPNYVLTKKAVEDGFLSAEEANDEKLTEKTIRNWGYFPGLFPYTKKQKLQNVIWLVVRNHERDSIVGYAVFGDSLGSKFCLNYLNLKAILLGKIARLLEDISLNNPWFEYFINGVKYISQGDFKILFLKIKKHIKIFLGK